MSCLTIAASELGTFFDPQDREMIDVLVDLWDGKKRRFVKATVGGGEVVATNPWLNLIACTTPAWIGEHISSHFTGGGFSSRSIFVFADSKRRLVPYPFLEMGGEEPKLRADLLSDLQGIASLFGEFKLTPAAIELGKAYYKRNYEAPPAALANDQLVGYLARKQTHLHKLAMVLAVAEGDDLIIEERHIKSAEDTLGMIEVEMPRIFAAGKKEPIAALAEAILQKMYELKICQRNELFRHFYKTMSYGTFDEAITHLLNTEFIVAVVQDTKTMLVINPEKADQKKLRLVVGNEGG